MMIVKHKECCIRQYGLQPRGRHRSATRGTTKDFTKREIMHW